jgi:hypothetical protein
MGGIAEKMLSDAVESLFNFDTDLAWATVNGDLRGFVARIVVDAN